MTSSRNGFTLIEVLVALLILAGLSLLTAQAIRSGIFNRNKFSKTISRESQVRDAMRVIERDINTAFHYRDMTIEMLNQIEADKKKAGQPTPAPGQPQQPAQTNPAQAANQKKPLFQLTFFTGTQDSINFTTLGHVRTTKDAAESDQAEVGYFLKTCRSFTAKSSSNCLWRRYSTVLDGEEAIAGTESVVMENVEELKFRYLGQDKEEFVETWKSSGGSGRDGGGDPNSVDVFPVAVEVTLKVLDKSDKEEKPVAMTMLAAVRFPNNPPKKKEGQK